MLKPIVIPSPNKKHKATLTQIGEIQPDHGYYSLSIDGFQNSFENRVFGRVCMWSAKLRFLAVQEWKEPVEGNPPKYYLLLIIDVLDETGMYHLQYGRDKGKYSAGRIYRGKLAVYGDLLWTIWNHQKL